MKVQTTSKTRSGDPHWRKLSWPPSQAERPDLPTPSARANPPPSSRTIPAAHSRLVFLRRWAWERCVLDKLSPAGRVWQMWAGVTYPKAE